MIKFLADMGVSTKTVLWLRNNGYEAVHLLEQGLYKLSDADVLEKARVENCVLLTMDLDFGYLLAISKQEMPSVILFRLQNETSENVNRRLSEVLTHLADELTSKWIIVSVDEKKIRVRRFPLNLKD